MTERTHSTPSRDYELLLMALAYPFVSALLLRFVAGPFEMFKLYNIILFSFVFPNLMIMIAFARRLAGTRYHPISLLVFGIWMIMLGFAHLLLVAEAAASV
jgi:hypothetical protein